MADIEKPDLTNKWAQEGAVIKPTDAKIRLGWTSEVPPHQWQNWWQQRVDSSLSYSLQKGIPEWDEEAEYIADKSFVQLGGDIYKCIQTNTGENPSSKPAYWKPLRDVYSEELELGSASKADMGTGGTQIRTNSQNDSRYIQGGSVTQSTGSSTTNVMSQKAVTDEFNTKADKSTTISAGIGLEGGGNLSANRTLSVKYGTSAGTAVQGNDSRVVNALQRGNNLSDITNPATARSNLGLGTAATRNVGTSSGNVMEVGAFGLGIASESNMIGLGDTYTGFVSYSSMVDSDGYGTPITSSTYGVRISTANTAFSEILINRNADTKVYIRTSGGGTQYRTQELLHTGNTTVDGNGFIKKASPVIYLYDNKIEIEGFEQETPAFEKVDVGVYRITGTSGLAQEGWYIDTPQDRNGNKYFNVDWEQDTTPELSSDGLLDEPANVTLIIRTFERVWNPATGAFDNGNPIDINELQSRHIALRFNEVRSESIDDEIERPANPLGDDNVD